MTLNITVITDQGIYQSADLRTFDCTIGRLSDECERVKPQIIRCHTWHATICFAGVGKTPDVAVGAWLAGQLRCVEFDQGLPALIDRLLGAESWLSRVAVDRSALTFTIGAFVKGRPAYLLVTNQEDLSRERPDAPARRLSVFEARPTSARTFVSGRKSAIFRATRWRLRCAGKGAEGIDGVFTALVQANAAAARRIRSVSPLCFTSYISIAGDVCQVVPGET
jgi:hypothetical protein